MADPHTCSLGRAWGACRSLRPGPSPKRRTRPSPNLAALGAVTWRGCISTRVMQGLSAARAYLGVRRALVCAGCMMVIVSVCMLTLRRVINSLHSPSLSFTTHVCPSTWYAFVRLLVLISLEGCFRINPVLTDQSLPSHARAYLTSNRLLLNQKRIHGLHDVSESMAPYRTARHPPAACQRGLAQRVAVAVLHETPLWGGERGPR